MNAPYVLSHQVRRLPNQDDLVRLIAKAHAAAVDSHQWNGFLQDYAQCVGGDSANYNAMDIAMRSMDFLVGWGMDGRFVDQYVDHYHSLDSWRASAYRFASGSVWGLPDVVDLDDYFQSEYYNDFLALQEIYHTNGVTALNEDGKYVVFNVFRSARKEAFCGVCHRFSRALAPHLSAAARTQYQLQKLKNSLSAFKSGLDSNGHALVYLDVDGRIHWLTRAAQDILDIDDALGCRGKKLFARHAAANSKLNNAISSAATAPKAGLAPLSARPIPIPKRTNGLPLVVFVMRLPATPFPNGRDMPSVLVRLEDPERVIEGATQVLIEVYGFTKAEARLAEHLVNGATLKEISARFRIGYGTAKTHLRHIFTKTNARSQADLVRKLLLTLSGFRE